MQSKIHGMTFKYFRKTVLSWSCVVMFFFKSCCINWWGWWTHHSHFILYFMLFSGGKGRICVQGNSVGANGPACSERRNGSRSAELCQGQACLFRYEFNIYSKNRNPPFAHCICWVSEKIFWPETSNIYLTFPLVLLGGEWMLGPHVQALAVVEPRLELCAAWRVPRAGQKR